MSEQQPEPGHYGDKITREEDPGPDIDPLVPNPEKK